MNKSMNESIVVGSDSTFGPIMRSKENKVVIDITNNSLIEINEEKTIIKLIPDNFQSEMSGTLFIVSLPETIETVKIPQNNRNIQLTIPQISNPNQDIIIDAEKSESYLILYCPTRANLIIPTDNNINIKGNNEIQIDSIEKPSSLYIPKITLDTDTNPSQMVLNSRYSNLIINEIQVFYSQNFIGQKSPQKTSCKILKLESGSSLFLRNISVETAQIGSNSSLWLDDSVSVSHFEVFYDRQNYSNETVSPLLIVEPFPDLNNTDIEIFKINAGQFLYYISYEAFIVAKFVSDNASRRMKACENLNFIKNDVFEEKICYDYDDYVLLEVRKKTGEGIKDVNKTRVILITSIVSIAIIIIIALIVAYCCYKKKKERIHSERTENLSGNNDGLLS